MPCALLRPLSRALYSKGAPLATVVRLVVKYQGSFGKQGPRRACRNCTVPLQCESAVETHHLPAARQPKTEKLLAVEQRALRLAEAAGAASGQSQAKTARLLKQLEPSLTLHTVCPQSQMKPYQSRGRAGRSYGYIGHLHGARCTLPSQTFCPRCFASSD